MVDEDELIRVVSMTCSLFTIYHTDDWYPAVRAWWSSGHDLVELVTYVRANPQVDPRYLLAVVALRNLLPKEQGDSN